MCPLNGHWKGEYPFKMEKDFRNQDETQLYSICTRLLILLKSGLKSRSDVLYFSDESARKFNFWEFILTNFRLKFFRSLKIKTLIFGIFK